VVKFRLSLGVGPWCVLALRGGGCIATGPGGSPSPPVLIISSTTSFPPLVTTSGPLRDLLLFLCYGGSVGRFVDDSGIPGLGVLQIEGNGDSFPVRGRYVVPIRRDFPGRYRGRIMPSLFCRGPSRMDFGIWGIAGVGMNRKTLLLSVRLALGAVPGRGRIRRWKRLAIDGFPQGAQNHSGPRDRAFFPARAPLRASRDFFVFFGAWENLGFERKAWPRYSMRGDGRFIPRGPA